MRAILMVYPCGDEAVVLVKDDETAHHIIGTEHSEKETWAARHVLRSLANIFELDQEQVNVPEEIEKDPEWSFNDGLYWLTSQLQAKTLTTVVLQKWKDTYAVAKDQIVN